MKTVGPYCIVPRKTSMESSGEGKISSGSGEWYFAVVLKLVISPEIEKFKKYFGILYGVSTQDRDCEIV